MAISKEPFWHCINGLLYKQLYCEHTYYHWLDLYEAIPAYGDTLIHRCPNCQQVTAVRYEKDLLDGDQFRLFAISDSTASYFGYPESPGSFFCGRGSVISPDQWKMWQEDFDKWVTNDNGKREIAWTPEEDAVLLPLKAMNIMVFAVHNVHKRWWRYDGDCYERWLKLKGQKE